MELRVSWQSPAEPNGIITSYTVYYSKSNGTGDDSLATRVVSGGVTETTVQGLTPYTFYDCYTSANTSVGEGNTSDTTTARTDESSKPELRLSASLYHFPTISSSCYISAQYSGY